MNVGSGDFMLARRVRSALFIDHENVGSLCPPGKIASWLQWIEDGRFDPEGRKRQLLEKRIYWNPTAKRHEEVFTRAGFEVILCEKLAMLKNGADIRIALDVMESINRKREIDEYIIFAKDTDYVPVLQRLEVKKKQSAILVDEKDERVFGIYDLYADIVIPIRIFRQAPSYERPRPLREALKRITANLKDWFARTPSAPSAAPPATVLPQPEPPEPPTAPAARSPMGAAVQRTIRVTSLKPNRYTGREDIEEELAKIKGFSKRGSKSYLGMGSYRALMREVAKRTGRIEVTDSYRGGVNVRYIPKESDD
jgi:hypothetical protein